MTGSALVLAWALSALLAAATARLVWRGGRTWNDHLVVAVVTGCTAIYPALFTLSMTQGGAWRHLGWALWPGPVAIYGLFHALDARRDPGPFWTWLARAAQPAMAFSLWTGLLLLIETAVFGLRFAAGTWTDALPNPWPLQWLGLPLLLTVWGTVWTYWRHFTVRRNVLRIAGMDADPLRVVHLSDIHASPVMVRADIRAIVERASALRPDLVVATGDFLMPFSEAEHAYLIEELASFRVPVLGCLGNHDLPVAERLAAEFRAAGMRLLVNESTVIEVRGRKVEVAGVAFHWRAARQQLDTALRSLPRPEADAHLLLAHDPRLFQWLPAGRFDLVLSGHTHGGQVGTDMFGIPWSVLRPLGVYDQGRFDAPQGSLWVHRGNWHTGLPPRMGIASEIVVHEVHA